MNIDEIVTLIKAVSEYKLTSLELEEDSVKLSIRREKESPQLVTVAAPAGAAAPGAVPVVTAVPEPASSETGNIPSDKVVTSPLVGTFYSSASPDKEPFVKEGDTVKKGQVLGIIEAMKLMNEIESEYDGVVEAVLVNNEDVVEYGQPLFRIR